MNFMKKANLTGKSPPTASAELRAKVLAQKARAKTAIEAEAKRRMNILKTEFGKAQKQFEGATDAADAKVFNDYAAKISASADILRQERKAALNRVK
jgi:hypothetical protein